MRLYRVQKTCARVKEDGNLLHMQAFEYRFPGLQALNFIKRGDSYYEFILWILYYETRIVACR
jgi:hypothetical protein